MAAGVFFAWSEAMEIVQLNYLTLHRCEMLFQLASTIQVEVFFKPSEAFDIVLLDPTVTKLSSCFVELEQSRFILSLVVHPLDLFQAILDVVVNLQFSLIEKLWQTFWRYSPPDTVEGATVTENR